MIDVLDKKQLEDTIVAVLKTVYDPEIPVDVYEMGLIYEVNIDDSAFVDLQMTLTSPSCPVAESLPIEIEEKIKGIFGVQGCKVSVVFDPPWDKSMMSEEALYELGLM